MSELEILGGDEARMARNIHPIAKRKDSRARSKLNRRTGSGAETG